MAFGKQYAFWPSEWMPAPQQDSWSIAPEDVRQTTETEVGAIIRPQFETDVLNAECTLVLNRMQSAWFETFEQSMIQEGLWFIFPVWYAGELRDGVVMFKSRPKWTVEAFTTTYQMSLLVQKRSLAMDACLLDLLECWPPCGTLGIRISAEEARKAADASTAIGG